MSLRDSLRIMIVDDMSVSRALIAQSLEELKISKYLTENDPKAALGKLVANPVHLVLSDMNMPGMNGMELLRVGQELGLNNLIRKPFTTATMKASIERVVGAL